VILTTHSYFLHHDAKQVARMTPYAPLATLIATALLEEAGGQSVTHFDSTFAEGVETFEAVLDRERPSLVAIMEDNFNFLTKMCTVRRREDALAMVAAAATRGCSVLVNGPDSSDRPEFYLNAGAEAVLMGEGESTLAQIAELRRDEPDAPLDGIPGLALRGPGKSVRRTPARFHLRALDALPFPAWQHIEVESYRRAWRSRHNIFSWNIATSRGCPYACNWCAKPTFGRGYEQRSPASVVSEMCLLKDTVGPDHIWFADDIFGLTTEWLRRFASEVIRGRVQTPFTMQSRVNLMKSDAVDALADAGAHEVWLGVESGSQKILDAMDKGSDVEEIRVATRALQGRGIRACWFIQLGYPGETWDDLCLTRDLIRSERPDDIGVSVAYPLPGTRFYDLVRAEMGERKNWDDSDDLRMLFQGTYNTEFYRMIRDVLHDEVRTCHFDDGPWQRLQEQEASHRCSNPVRLAS
jgi:anaerobic magnesium-protoporphyrin IX monomethyl ester cyclase